jgi:hypothetical protein
MDTARARLVQWSGNAMGQWRLVMARRRLVATAWLLPSWVSQLAHRAAVCFLSQVQLRSENGVLRLIQRFRVLDCRTSEPSHAADIAKQGDCEPDNVFIEPPMVASSHISCLVFTSKRFLAGVIAWIERLTRHQSPTFDISREIRRRVERVSNAKTSHRTARFDINRS